MVGKGEVDRRIQELKGEYGDFPVQSETYDLTPEQYSRAHDLHTSGVPGTARVWVERDEEVLLVRTEHRPESWGVPGGFIEPKERADRAGEREVHEETGVECSIFDISYIHRATRRHENGEEPPLEEFAVAFIAEYEGGELRRQESEIRDLKWWSEIPKNSYSPVTRIAPNRLG